MVKVRIVTESDTGEEAIFEGESEEAYGEIKQQESDQFTSPRYDISEVEIEGYEPIGEEEYDETLDDIYPEYKIGYSTFYASDILKKMDPTAYRIGKQEYQESRIEDVQDEVKSSLDLEDDYSSSDDNIFGRKMNFDEGESEQGFWDSVFQVLWNN